MAVTAKDVAALRAKTGAGMLDCKKALDESNGDIDKALAYLKEKGITKAAKKSSRIAAEGLLGIKVADTYASAAIVEINSETDFVAKNDSFVSLVEKTTGQVFANEVSTVEELQETSCESTTFSEYFTTEVAKIGEKIVIRRFVTLHAGENGVVNGYIHSNGRVGALVAAKCDSAKTAEQMAPMLKNVAMHIAAMKPSTLSYKDFDPAFVEEETKGRIESIKKENEELGRLGKTLKNIPQYISRLQITEEVLETEKNRIREELKAEGKPESIWDNIIPGKLERFMADNTSLDNEQALLDQGYVMDENMSVAEAVAVEAKKLGGTAEIVEFIKYEVGEGIEKAACNLAQEVAEQLGE